MNKHKPQHYYTDPFEAIYMIEKYGVKTWIYAPEKLKRFGVPDAYDWLLHGDYKGYETDDDYEEVSMITEAVSYIKENTPDKIYVTHKDPEFFEPKCGDLGKDGAERLWKFVIDKWIPRQRATSPVYPVRIIEREGEHFFMPKIEQIEAN